MSSDLRERFSIVDEIGKPDLWTEARRRSTEVDHRLGGRSDAAWSPDSHRLVTAAVAFAVFVAAALFAWDLSHPDVAPSPPPAVNPPVDLAAELPHGWSELPAPPEVRSGAATAWTGSMLLVWGGYVFDGSGNKTPNDDGFAFDAATQDWSRLPASPLGPRSFPAAAWTGSEFVIWGGFYPAGASQFLGDGAAYDPANETWRRLPDAPVSDRAPFSVWTGRELIVWGNASRDSHLSDGAAYDASSDTWRRIAGAPVELSDATAVWTGDEMVVFGSNLDFNNRSETPTAVGAAYDPAADRWRELPSSELSPQAHTAGWPGGEMIVWDYEHGTAAYDPTADLWRSLNDVPLRFFECYPRSATIPGYVFGEFCGQLTMFSVAEDRWREITRDDLRDWLIEPLPTRNAFLVLAHSLELSEEPGVTFDTRMLAYVPPIADATGDVRDPSPFVPATEITGDTVSMPLVFPDGTRVTLIYPAELRLAELGIQPDISYVWRENPGPRFPIVFLHDPDASIAPFVDPDGPVRLINTAHGGIEVWRARGNDVERRFWIRFELPSWTALVSVRDALSSAVEVAAALDLRETSSGFPVVEASGQIALAEGFGEAEGPQLGIGDGSADPSRTSLDHLILLSPEGCRLGEDEISPSGEYASLCLGGRVFVSMYGDPRFLRVAFESLAIEGALRT